MGRYRRLAAICVAVACLAGAAPPSVPGFTDITASALGRAVAQRAAARLAALGAGSPAGDLVVLRDASGLTVGPRTASYLASGGQAMPLTPAARAAVVTGVPSWSPVASQCFSRISDTFTWLDHCYVLYRLAGEGDPLRDWFALHHYATMQPNPPWVLNGAEIGSQPLGPTPQSWADWSPRSDYRGPCQQIVVGVTSPVGGIADTVTQCETWTIAKSPAGGSFSVHWDGRGRRTSRQLAMQISVSVPQGAWPQWALPAWVSGSPF